MRVRHRHGRSPRGLGLVEFVIVLPVAIVFVLGIVQAGFIYMAKLQINHATFQAARLGSLHNADEGVMKTALMRSLSPFYQNNFETNDSVRLAKAKAETELDQILHPVKLERLNPSALSFDDFGVKDPKSGKTYIPNDNLEWRLDKPGATSQQRLRDANVLKIRVVYAYQLKVPLMMGVLKRVMCGGQSGVDAFGNVGALDAVYPGGVSDECLRYYLRDRMPIESFAVVEMQTRAER
ncbi:pilus assembly protein [Pelomonas sp. APW6]|uniref:Pilus assembly protein n=1 Tax=Roseateles subflavus TaxID=3053353 RepID=A0ABT7LEQ7_9BURK|nr:TadE family protein [Pelomonas sp. APW6]MDL5031339.1 pilus assembly protein [Pelomonas sp. APW6]